MKLDEIKMSPGLLKAQASKLTDAKIGIEFELIVKDVGLNSDEDFTSEIDYSADQGVDNYSWERLSGDIEHFFAENNVNTHGEIQYVLDRAENMYNKWVKEQWDEYVKDHFDQWAAARLETHPNEEHEEQMDEFREQRYNHMFIDLGYADLSNWLGEEELNRMRDWAERFDLAWPYYTEPPEHGMGEGSRSFSEISHSFGEAVGMPVKFSIQYHNSERTDTSYIMEPDSSLTADRRKDLGLEFVSPPLPINTMIHHIHAVKIWALESDNAYTNNSCGLHMNISFPGYDLHKLDYIKLVLFLGDDWVSNQFGRLGTYYAKSALNNVKSTAKYSRDFITDIFDSMRESLMLKASKLIHSGLTEKYMTINIHNNRVEFRAPGGNWLDMDINVVINTMLRCVVALDIALDTEKYKKEYANKFYKLISPTKDDDLHLFTQYQSGLLSAVELKKNWAHNILYKKNNSKSREHELARKIVFTRNWNFLDFNTDSVIFKFKATSWTEADKIARKYAQSHNIPDGQWDVTPAP